MKHFFETKCGLYLGQNEIERPAYLGTLAKSMHTQIIGATGVGKTDSAMLPMVFDGIRNGHSIIFIDPKGDRSTFETLKLLCSSSGRENDLIAIDLGNTKTSSCYNPLKIGSPSELKDKIIGSIVWTEEFYKKIAERILLNIFLLLEEARTPTSLSQITQILDNPESLKDTSSHDLARNVDVDSLIQSVKINQKNLEGVRSDLELWTKSDIGTVLSQPDSDSVLDWIQKGKIVYINLQTLAFEETSRRFGRLILQDLKTAVQRLQALEVKNRRVTSVYIDEFASLASSGFVELLNKARSANVNLTLAHQSLGDLTAVSPSFANQILDNTNTKIIFRLDSPDTSDFFARLVGTRKSEKKTIQVNNGGLLGTVNTGLGTTRDTDEFIISPNDFRQLGRGCAFVLTKIPYEISRVQLQSINQWIDAYSTPIHERRTGWSKFLSF
jgi:type IV secretory pathway TraG/TraD family ATPase VirD4